MVLGAGPGGYTAAFRAADLGKKVVLVERYPDAGRRVPERRLHSVEGAAARRQGDHRSRGGRRTPASRFGKPKIDLAKLRAWKDGVVGKLTKGLAGLAKQRKVEVVQGEGKFASPHTLRVRDGGRREDGRRSTTASSPRARHRRAFPAFPTTTSA